MTPLLAALAALEQEWRDRASKLPGPRHPTSWYAVYTQAADQLAALRMRFEGEGWQPIETAPKDADILLLYADGWDTQPGYWDEQIGWVMVETQSLTGGLITPTHWMPLPAPPGPDPEPVKETR